MSIDTDPQVFFQQFYFSLNFEMDEICSIFPKRKFVVRVLGCLTCAF